MTIPSRCASKAATTFHFKQFPRKKVVVYSEDDLMIRAATAEILWDGRNAAKFWI